MITISTVVQQFILARTADGRAPRTIKDYHRVLEPFSAWCANAEMDTDVLDRSAVRRYIAVIRWEDALTIEEIICLLDQCEGDPLAVRDRAIILTFLDSGLRLGEMVILKRSDVHIDGEAAWIRVYAPKTRSQRFAFLQSLSTGP